MTLDYMTDFESKYHRAEKSRRMWRAAFIGSIIGFVLVVGFCCALLAGWINP